jgi:hypothetical protein
MAKRLGRLAVTATAAAWCAFACSAVADGQPHNIPQQLAESGQSLVYSVGVVSGTRGDPKSDEYGRQYTERLLSETKRVVRGRIGQPAGAYLSDDQMEIYTDYRLRSRSYCTTRMRHNRRLRR